MPGYCRPLRVSLLGPFCAVDCAPIAYFQAHSARKGRLGCRSRRGLGPRAPVGDIIAPTMAASGNEILDPLDAAERGFVLGALLLHPGGDADSAVALEPPSDARCGEALARIAALPRTERVKLTRQLAREAVAPIPAGIEEVPEAVLAALLRDEPPDILRLVEPSAPRSVRQMIAARLAVEPPPPTRPPVSLIDEPRHQVSSDRSMARGRSATSRVSEQPTRPLDPPPRLDEGGGPNGPSPELVLELQRALFSRVVPVLGAAPGSDPTAGTTARRLLLLDPARLLTELSRRGASVLGHSLRGARRDVILRAAALAGAPWSEAILAVAESRAEDGPPELDRAAALELVAALAPAPDPRETVTRLGARAAGAQMTWEGERGLGGADQARAVAQRLPPAIAAELLAGAGLGVEGG